MPNARQAVGDYNDARDAFVVNKIEMRLDCTSTFFPYPIPCDDYPTSSCLQSSEELEQEVAGAGRFVLAVVGQALQVDRLVAAPEQTAADTVAVV